MSCIKFHSNVLYSNCAYYEILSDHLTFTEGCFGFFETYLRKDIFSLEKLPFTVSALPTHYFNVVLKWSLSFFNTSTFYVRESRPVKKKSSADLNFVQFVWSLKLMQFHRKTNEKRSRSIKQKTRLDKNLSRIDTHMWF